MVCMVMLCNGMYGYVCKVMLCKVMYVWLWYVMVYGYGM